MEILSPDGGRFGILKRLLAWCCDDRISAILRRPGMPDQPFEALMPVKPMDISKIMNSAAMRVATSNPFPEVRGIRSDCPALHIHQLASPLRRGIKRLLFGAPKWRLAQLLSDPLATGPAQVQELPCDFPLEMADPFLIQKDGTDWVFFESIKSSGMGELVVSQLVDDSVTKPSRSILDLPFHLSWPNVFEHGGKTYMVPETGSANEVGLWVCDEFPMKWSKVRTLVEGAHFHDGTIVRHGGRWWLFVSVGGSYYGDHSAELRIYHSDDLLTSPFVPHPRNPISLSIEGARPAGRFFVRDNVLYRPAQDGRDGYGKGVIVFRVDRLDESNFAETPVSHILAPTGMQGIHTLNQISRNRWIVDIRRSDRRLPAVVPFAAWSMILPQLECLA
ncbi:MAG TPA: hypothetical protein PKY05_11345 [Fibrobacteria bacterium]|nr:hypothetical protein [Fibrobacteria bacterium]